MSFLIVASPEGAKLWSPLLRGSPWVKFSGSTFIVSLRAELVILRPATVAQSGYREGEISVVRERRYITKLPMLYNVQTCDLKNVEQPSLQRCAISSQNHRPSIPPEIIRA